MVALGSAQQLPLRERNVRIGWILAGLPVLFFLRIVDPNRVGSYFPLPISCGALTGLPCLFCGITRAVHHLLNGEWERALYFNWLVYPMAAGFIFFTAISTLEIVSRRRLIGWTTQFHWTRRMSGYAAVILLALWSLHASLAVTQHKHELLNPRGPLYALFVR